MCVCVRVCVCACVRVCVCVCVCVCLFSVLRSFEKEDFLENSRILSCRIKKRPSWPLVCSTNKPTDLTITLLNSIWKENPRLLSYVKQRRTMAFSCLQRTTNFLC